MITKEITIVLVDIPGKLGTEVYEDGQVRLIVVYE